MRAPKPRILVIDDDGPERDIICRELEGAGYKLDCVVTAIEGREHVARYGAPDLLLLAIRPASRADEVALCREIHAAGDIPIVALAATTEERAPMLLEECIDDFITRPAKPPEVVYRVRRCLRRRAYPQAESGPNGHGIAAANGDVHAVAVEGQTIYLSDREAELLRLLLRYANRVLSQEYLLQQVWGDRPVSEGTLRVAIHRLRRRLQELLGGPPRILSVRGRGYLYLADPETTGRPGATPPRAIAYERREA